VATFFLVDFLGMTRGNSMLESIWRTVATVTVVVGGSSGDTFVVVVYVLRVAALPVRLDLLSLVRMISSY